eukprot:PITA_24605
MEEEMNSLQENKTWELVNLPKGRKALQNKWVYNIKHQGDEKKERYKARVVVKGFSQKEDIAYSVGVVSRFLTNPGKRHWHAVKWILRYLKDTSHYCLCFGHDETMLEGFTDADMARDMDTRKSTTGYLYTLGGVAVSWVSRLQRIVALSTTEVEYIATT